MNTNNKPERAAINFTERSNQCPCRHFMFKDSVSKKPGALVNFSSRQTNSALRFLRIIDVQVLLKNQYIVMETGDETGQRDDHPDSQN